MTFTFQEISQLYLAGRITTEQARSLFFALLSAEAPNQNQTELMRRANDLFSSINIDDEVVMGEEALSALTNRVSVFLREARSPEFVREGEEGFPGFEGRVPAETLEEGFDRYLATTGMGRVPAMRGGAMAAEQLLRLQFGLQQPGIEGAGLTEFRDFLMGGQSLTGTPLQERLNILGTSLTTPAAMDLTSPYQKALRGRFDPKPWDAFQTFAIPQLQKVAPAFRPGLYRTLKEEYNQLMATRGGLEFGSEEVARHFGYGGAPASGVSDPRYYEDLAKGI